MFPRLNMGKLMLIAMVMLSISLSMVLQAQADTVPASGNWLYATYYCGSGVCVPISINHKANVTMYRYSITNGWVIYRQDFGGLIHPGESLCGSHNWVRGSTYYSKASGNETIGGWSDTGSYCSGGDICHSYTSNESHSVYPGNSVNFSSLGSFTSRCNPSSVPRTVSKGF